MVELGTSDQFNRVSMGRILSPRCFSLQELPLSSFGEHLVLTPDLLQISTIRKPFFYKGSILFLVLLLCVRKRKQAWIFLRMLGICLSSHSTELISKGHRPTPHGPHHLLGLHRGAHQLWGFGLKSTSYKKSHNAREPERRKACPGSLKI